MFQGLNLNGLVRDSAQTIKICILFLHIWAGL